MECCEKCFLDYNLQAHIQSYSESRGDCSFCGGRSVSLFPADRLCEHFEPLFELYQESDDPGALPLFECIQRDWEVFATDAPRWLLGEIIGSVTDVDMLVAAVKPKDSGLVNRWTEFAEELKHQNRYFPESLPSGLDRLLIELEQPAERGRKFFRARINRTKNVFGESNLRAPPPKKARSGRANPIGIPYLYLSSNEKTAILEVRPEQSDTVVVAEFENANDLRLVDLRHPRSTVSPFLRPDEDDLGWILYSGLPLLEHLGNELARPVRSDVAELDYLPTQYLCELIKKQGLDGIIHRSSFNQGDNFATFSDGDFSFIGKSEYRVEQIDLTAYEV